MAITRWEPFQEIERWDPFHWEPMREIESLQRQMNRLFDRMMPTTNGESGRLAFIPAAEMEETADRLILKLEIPGLEAKDLDIKVTEQSISIAGEKKRTARSQSETVANGAQLEVSSAIRTEQEETKTEDKGTIRSEFHYGKFERVINLPVHIQSDRVKAEYKNGILHLTLPKVEQEKRKTVKVEIV